MSLRRDERETSADRVKKLRKSLPPDPKVARPKLTYASQDYFAQLVGAPSGAQGRQRVIAWEKGAEPDERYRERMAELSGGVYTADDFTAGRTTRAALEERVAELERGLRQPSEGKGLALVETLARLEEMVESLERSVESLRSRIEALERRPPGAAAGSARGRQ